VKSQYAAPKAAAQKRARAKLWERVGLEIEAKEGGGAGEDADALEAGCEEGGPEEVDEPGGCHQGSERGLWGDALGGKAYGEVADEHGWAFRELGLPSLEHRSAERAKSGTGTKFRKSGEIRASPHFARGTVRRGGVPGFCGTKWGAERIKLM
jgi:hypothetical protein